jgi:sterol 14-demethylase
MASSYLYHTKYQEQMKVVIPLLQNYDITLPDKDPTPKPDTQTKWSESPCRIRYVRR